MVDCEMINFMIILIFYHLFIYSWEEMVEMRNEKNDFGKNKRRGFDKKKK